MNTTHDRDLPSVASSPEMYPVCARRNDASAFMRFLGADSGARFAASREDAEASGAWRAAVSYVRGLRWAFR